MKVRVQVQIPAQWRRLRAAWKSGPCRNGKPMVEPFGLSDAGCVRSNNEDYYLIAPDLGLYIVADGMGGAQAGEYASKLAVETVCDVVQQNGAPSAETLLRAFEEANRRVLTEAATSAQLEGMGTTLVAALEAGEELIIASVGDSRAYIYDDGRLVAATEDQTWVHEIGRRLGLDEESLKQHPMRHVLTMAIGVSAQLRVHTSALRLHPGGEVLLCSDGLHGVVAEEEIHAILASGKDLEIQCRALIAAARTAGGPDNITAVLLRVP